MNSDKIDEFEGGAFFYFDAKFDRMVLRCSSVNYQCQKFIRMVLPVSPLSTCLCQLKNSKNPSKNCENYSEK